ncbi:MAG: tRNA (adenosine(37)-N6)-dimethylallyltransferase MiaA [Actinomycetota bacterium]|nr:tRNA (adenosine(37)-N6)-dimethylallyltransferase MiaA [Actinomycetota bacterium]
MGAPPLALVGPTASGKSEAAIELARSIGAEIVSVDSMLVYRGMDVGTAKPTSDQRAMVPHHLIDVADPSEPFSVVRYQALARTVLEGLRSRGGRPFLVGGSGLYFRAVVDDLEFPGTDASTREELERQAQALGARGLHGRLVMADPVAAGRIEPGNARRTVRALEVAAVTGRPFSSFAEAWRSYPPAHVRAVGVALERETLTGRVRRRVDRMLELGLLDEVRELLSAGLGGWLTSTQAIGYAEMTRHLRGELSLEEAVAGIVRRTNNLARRQMTWFLRDPRIRWVAAGAGGAMDVVHELHAELEGG